MGVAKVTLNGTTLMDVTSKTVTSSTMLSAITALDKAGNSITGTYENGTYLTAFTKRGGDLIQYSSPGSNSGMKRVTFPNPLSYLEVTPSSEWQDFTYGDNVTVITQIDSGTNPNSTTYTKTVNVGSSTLVDYRGDLVLRAQVALTGDEIVEKAYLPITAKVDDNYNLIEFPEQSFGVGGASVNVSITTSQTTISITATRTIMLVKLAFITTPTAYSDVSVAPAPSFYDITIYGNYGSYINRFVEYSGSRYYSQSDVIHVTPGDSISICVGSNYKYGSGTAFMVNNGFVSSSNTSSATYTYTPTNGGQVWWSPYYTPSTSPAGMSGFYGFLDEYATPISTLDLTSNGSTINVYDYRWVNANIGGSYGIALNLLASGTMFSQGNTVYNYTSSDMTAFCDSLSSISSYMFAGKTLRGNFTFTNALSVGAYGFGWPYTQGAGGYTVDGRVNLPSVSSLSYGAFVNHRNIAFVSMPSVTLIPGYTFASCTISSVYVPNCTSIGVGAFLNCGGLTSVSFSKCTYVSDSAFTFCYSLSSVYLPECTQIGANAFSNCLSLTSIGLPKVTTIGPSAFTQCSNLTSVNAQKCTTVSTNAFYSCGKLHDLSLPLCATIGSSAFENCSSLVAINLPSCISIRSFAFAKNYSLTTVSVPICSIISNYAFQSCYNLISFYLNSVSSVTSIGVYTFASTPISNYSTSAGRYGSVFVPASLYSAFITATNWIAISSRIVSV